MSDREFQAAVVGWSVGVLLMVFAFAASAEQVCQSVYDPMNGKWVYECVERPSQVSGPPMVCRQVYDAMNNVWVTVCE